VKRQLFTELRHCGLNPIPRHGSLLLSLLTALAACGGRTSLGEETDLLPSASGRGGGTSVAGSAAGGASGSGIAGAGLGGGGVAGIAGSGSAGTTSGGTAGVPSAGAAGVGGAAGMPNVPLWRKSTQAYCGTPGAALNRNPIWSDARGVYMLTSTGSTQSSIDFNAGTGWKLASQSQKGPSLPSLTGFVGGPLVEYGSSACAITLVDGSSSSCSAASSQVTSVSIVDAKLGYAVYQDRVLRYDGMFWTQWGPPLEAPSTYAWGVWASPETVVVVADEARIFLQQQGELRLQKGVPDGDYRATWGFAANDIWAANTIGQLVHYDGQGWSLAGTIGGECPGIRSLWGSDGVLFFATDHSVGMLKGTQVQSILAYPCDSPISVMGIWGNSKQELFIALQAFDEIESECGGIQLKWFDGSTVKPL